MASSKFGAMAAPSPDMLRRDEGESSQREEERDDGAHAAAGADGAASEGFLSKVASVFSRPPGEAAPAKAEPPAPVPAPAPPPDEAEDFFSFFVSETKRLLRGEVLAKDGML